MGRGDNFGGDEGVSFPTAAAPEETKKKGTRSRPAKVRKHAVALVYKNDLPAFLDKLHAAGGVFLFATLGIDSRGFEVASYTEE